MRIAHRHTVRGAAAALVIGSLGLLAPATASADTFIDASNPCLGDPGDAPFTDRGSISPVHLENVDCMFAADIFLGTNTADGRAFQPTVAVSRGQMAVIVVRALQHAGYEVPVNTEDAFSDDDGTAFETSINIVASLGIVSGFGDGTFRPGDRISRAQQVTFVVRTAEVAFGSTFPAVTSNPYRDVPSTSPHLANIVTATDVLGLTSGKGDGTFDPGAPTSRQEMATFTTRLVDLILLDATSPANDPGAGPLLESEEVSLG